MTEEMFRAVVALVNIKRRPVIFRRILRLPRTIRTIPKRLVNQDDR